MTIYQNKDINYKGIFSCFAAFFNIKHTLDIPLAIFFQRQQSKVFIENFSLSGGAETIFTTTGSRHVHGLNGCIRDLKIGIKNIELITKATNGHNVGQC